MTEKEKEIIRNIRDDEKKHNQILRELYYSFTGQMLPTDTSVLNMDNKLSYKELKTLNFKIDSKSFKKGFYIIKQPTYSNQFSKGLFCGVLKI